MTTYKNRQYLIMNITIIHREIWLDGICLWRSRGSAELQFQIVTREPDFTVFTGSQCMIAFLAYRINYIDYYRKI